MHAGHGNIPNLHLVVLEYFVNINQNVRLNPPGAKKRTSMRGVFTTIPPLALLHQGLAVIIAATWIRHT